MTFKMLKSAVCKIYNHENDLPVILVKVFMTSKFLNLLI